MKMLDSWMPNDGFGDPVACFATSFTFDSDFFTTDCLSRFLSLSSQDPEMSSGLDIAGMLEEEEKLATTQVSILVDQSCRPDNRNLRWDLLPVRVPGGLLHAKVALLIWENATRVILGSANLTPAGYRQQVEIAVVFDLDANCSLPKSVLRDLATELRELISLSPGSSQTHGPIKRAISVVDLFEKRIDESPLTATNARGTRYFLSCTGKNRSVLEGLDHVWSGARPTSAFALSPFWDRDPRLMGAKALFNPILRKRASESQLRSTFLVRLDAQVGRNIALAPKVLKGCAPSVVDHQVRAFAGRSDKNKEDSDRILHAKCLQYRSDYWVATMIGSSNMTAKGLGLEARPHREINLWIGNRRKTPEGKALSRLIPEGLEIDDEVDWKIEEQDEEDSDTTPLHPAFLSALIVSPSTIDLSFEPERLPPEWSVLWKRPGEQELLLVTKSDWISQDSPSHLLVSLEDDKMRLPSLLDVSWNENGADRSAVWFVNVADSSLLPPPQELKSLPVDILLSVLMSSRPMRQVLEDELRRLHKHDDLSADELDPLRRFNSSGFLLQRTRKTSAALAGMERRLSQQIFSLDALDWRLSGTLGPENIGRLLAESAAVETLLQGETHFVLAELALTISRIDWSHLCPPELLPDVQNRIHLCLKNLKTLADSLDDSFLDESLRQYFNDAFAEALK